MKKFIWGILNAMGIGAYVQLYLNGYLIDKAWPNSFHKKQAIDGSNNPIPWLTYPFITFIAPRLTNQMTMFEFGAGNSTLWFSKKVKQIKSVEHNKEWYTSLSKNLPNNVSLVFQEDSIDGDYAKEVLAANTKYDIVLIDANDRFHCSKYALQSLSDSGVIILDNSERIEYKVIYDLIQSNGFKFIDFEGLSAGVQINSTTTVFYRPNNCLNI